MTGMTTRLIMATIKRTIHGVYNAPNADLVLETEDHVLFRVHSFIMTMASGMFCEMLDTHVLEGDQESIPLTEHSDTFAIILDIVYPDAPSPEHLSLAAMQSVAEAAHKFDMPKVVAHLRNIFRNTEAAKFSANSLQLYALACRFNWKEEINLASAYTLGLDLSARDVRGHLQALDTKSLLRLHDLHQYRIQSIIQIIRTCFTKNHRTSCPALNDSFQAMASNLTLSYLEVRVRAELEACPLGETLKKSELWREEEIANLGSSKCRLCQREPPSVLFVQTLVTVVLNNLPKVVDDVPKVDSRPSYLSH